MTPTDMIVKGLKPGDVLAFADKSLTSRAIRWATRGQVSHVAVVLDVWQHDAALIEPTTDTAGRVEKTYLQQRLGKYQPENNAVYWLILDYGKPFDRMRFVHGLLNEIRKPYAPARALWSAFGWITNSDRYTARRFCSEVVCLALQSAGTLPQELCCSEVTPADLVRAMLWADAIQLSGYTAQLRDLNTWTIDDLIRKSRHDNYYHGHQ